MTLLEIRTFGHPVLRTAGRPVAAFDGELARLVDDMFETMEAAPGVGLAAPQVGLSRRLFVFDSTEERGAVANPRITWRSEETEEAEEGCLSVPGIYLPVERAAAVRLEGEDPAGGFLSYDAEGFLARIFQHETDHCDGVLFLDRLTPERRREAMRAIREQDFGDARPPPRSARAL